MKANAHRGGRFTTAQAPAEPRFTERGLRQGWACTLPSEPPTSIGTHFAFLPLQKCAHASYPTCAAGALYSSIEVS